MSAVSSTETRKVEAPPASAADTAGFKPKRFHWVRGRRAAVFAAAALAVAAIAFGSVWFGFAAILPLLYLLPCAAMIYFCRK